MKRNIRRTRRGTALLLIVALLVSVGVTTVEAGVVDSINRGLDKVGTGIRKGVNWMNGVVDSGRGLVIGTVSIGGGLLGALGGAIVGGLTLGPVGFFGGAVAGYFLGKGLTSVLMRSSLPMIAGAVIGGVLVSSMGLPAIMCGAFIGGAAGHFLAKGRIGNDRVFSVAPDNQDRLATQYIQQAQTADEEQLPDVQQGEVMLRQASTVVTTDAQAHEAYRRAYQNYTQATQKGDVAEAQKWLAIYQEAARALKSPVSR